MKHILLSVIIVFMSLVFISCAKDPGVGVAESRRVAEIEVRRAGFNPADATVKVKRLGKNYSVFYISNKGPRDWAFQAIIEAETGAVLSAEPMMNVPTPTNKKLDLHIFTGK